MQGVITRTQVLAHPIVIVESFGVKVLVRALLADPRSVDMRSRATFERFFVMTKRHLAYCRERVAALRAAHAVVPAATEAGPRHST